MTDNKDNLDFTKDQSSRRPKSTTPSTVKKPENKDALGAMIKVTIDGKDVKVPMGTTILEAAQELGITIPTLCDHSDLCVAGVCRICVVEVEGQNNLQASCAYPITDPIKVKTHSRKVRQARRHI